ncbi:MAG: universal stress protein [Candidatus Obscuribacterales bacterium]|jgi:nucleotide-binding universal stress UspA family protein|nr:universal stress protein [Candidatus Obscuribacterales bacterium]
MKVIAAIDGSVYSQAAVDALSGIQWPPGTEIKLLTVLRPGESNFPASSKSPSEITGTQSAAKALALMTVRLQQLLVECKISSEFLQGEPKGQILEYCKQWGAELIVMGTRGNKGLDLILLGSISQGVLMQSQCPVLVVKSDPNHATHATNKFKNVLVTTDNSPYSDAALTWLKSLVWPEDTNFRLTTVVQRMSDSLLDLGSAALAERVVHEHDGMKEVARKQLELVKADLESKVGSGRVSIDIGEGDPREVILQMAQSWSADLVVMGSHGRTGLKKLLLGSVSQAVAIHCPCSVAIVKGVVQPGQAGIRETGRFQVPKDLAKKKIIDT